MKNKCLTIFIILLCIVAGAAICYYLPTPQHDSKREVIRMAISPDYPPYSYMYKGELTGIDVEIGKMIAAEAGCKLRIDCDSFSNLIDSIRLREADMAICALAITEKRRKSAVFSDPYEFAGQVFLIRKEESIHSLFDMKGRVGFRIGAEEGSSGYLMIEHFLRENHGQAQLIGYPNNREATTALINNKLDAIILDPLVARSLQMEYPGRMDILKDPLNHEAFAVAVSPDAPQLLAVANRVIHRLWKTGEIYLLQEKHIKQALKKDPQ